MEDKKYRKPKAMSDQEWAERERARLRALSQRRSLAGRDIGDIPEISEEWSAKRDACRSDFRLFCETFFGEIFHLEWSQDHLRVLSKAQSAVLDGGLFALAMPRGSGKTTIAECACLWSVLYGHHQFVCLIGSDASAAESMLDTIKSEIENNDSILLAFPEAAYPIRRLGGINNRASGQLHDGERTRIAWTADEIIMPTIGDSPCSGSIIRVAGITGRIRGMKFVRPDGKSVRPSLVIIDDPQTDESARSFSQSESRVRVLSGAILGLGGPGQKIAGIMPCTVISPGDMADQILDRAKHPEWNGERTKMMYSFPKNQRLWDEYAEVRANCLREKGDISDATAFYSAHRADMDEGAEVAWSARFNHDELSAIQHAMNLRLLDEAAFSAEYQNEPLKSQAKMADKIDRDYFASKCNGLPRGVVPDDATTLSAFIDIQLQSLWWMVAAWSEKFTGYVIDYGVFPEQPGDYPIANSLKNKLEQRFPSVPLEGRIVGALGELVNSLCGKAWKNSADGEFKIDRLLIDANWGESTDSVYAFCRATPHSGVVMPSHGKYFSVLAKPIDQWKRNQGEKIGPGWRVSARSRRSIRSSLADVNHWKTITARKILSSLGVPGGITLFGKSPHAHRCLADHIGSETRHEVANKGRVVDEWKCQHQVDNHWWDCLVGCTLAASIQGIRPKEIRQPDAPAPRRVSFKEMQAARRNLR